MVSEPASHYFSSPAGPAARRTLQVSLAGREVDVVTSSGVFSGHRLDLGTKVLLAAAPAPPPAGDLLDLGCGWGPIALSLALLSPQARVWAVDVNERALELTRENAASLGITTIRAVTPDQVPADLRFGTIWSNPPIRVGKLVLHELMRTWLPRLKYDASARLVVQRNLGADSLITWIAAELSPLTAQKSSSAKGFRVIEVKRST